ncbi:ABC transporter ATP-binding protein [Aneurinibacillus sp. Ricciae_BoGa-3]|uniref:ABC transporter ATP-binding protein n=1 Tax=Aneurinibacillus sp. Ricciae_BoGa-3 TaxID=3022697 RepID=UPI00233FD845|nr:ABC transporter ATP-binding protein [Aneurinibacillus sp. Ricciae_BoGa-3]WCK53553.1 ABC transporter ATP-binding protein [Aneurinibacillus sp. Ricciae_BoGa-3]
MNTISSITSPAESMCHQTEQAGYKIKLQAIRKDFRSQNKILTAIENISLEIKEGEFVCIVGPSGCGKTTLLRIVAGLEEKTSGTVSIMHRDCANPLKSTVFQEHSIFPWMTVRNNIAYGLKMRKMPKKLMNEITDHYIHKIGLNKFSDAYPHQLSGGMKQRVSIARAFANDPEILLMDEPFSNLDEQNRFILQMELLRIWEETRKTVVFITHSIDEAIFLSDRVFVMTAHPGTIKANFPVNFPRPRTIEEVRQSEQFQHLLSEIWALLKSEVAN